MALSRTSSTTYLRLCILSTLGVFAMNTTAATSELNIVSAMNDSELPEVELDKIVVTATRTPTKTSNVIAQTRVIDKEDLKRFQGQNALDIIKRQPGISHYTNGGPGTTSNFYMRGYDNKQILVLIDGVRYSSISAGGATLSLLPADQIDRIEILYGASGSSIYGADAMGGVIQVFTKGANIGRSNVSVTAGIGSHNEYLYGASAQFTNEKGTTLGLSANHNETDGYNATLPSNLPSQTDNDGFKSNNYSLSFSQKINDNLKFGVTGIYSKSKTDIDSYDDYLTNAPALENAFAEQNNGAASAYIEHSDDNGSNTKLTYGYSIDESTTYETSLKNGSGYNTNQQQISLIRSQNLPIGKAVFGAEHLNQELKLNVYEAADRKVTSGFAGYNLVNNTFDLQANLRHDDYSDFDSKTTYSLGGAYHINQNLRTGASYAKGFRVPTFNDLYYPDSGNPNLKPETSDNYETFIEYDTDIQSTRLTGYHNKVDDLIGFVSIFDANGYYAGGSSENVDKAKIEGVTLTSDWIVDSYLFGGSYDYQQAKNDSGGLEDGNFLAIRPEHKAMVYAGYRLPSLDVRAEYQYIGDYYSDVANTDSQLVNSYGLLNISGNYKLTDNLSMTARLNNIANKKYITLPGYNTDGTNFFTSLTYNWF
ncbi:TonB-dependent receptor [Psychrobacter sp. DAB_AL32B]|uniref:TonB-dependent receptor domain-containing protein n=1 Tax=Psychrobacter sp. DAB_AL32B TaxID=1028414 RepID=UPI000B7FA4BA|nr:TonB-dependent receptor [Psychrobacter sp. DAB_AL32B]OXL25251.1 ligand-gated channel [Psychrobacter sp. DAB_AL32B]